MFTVFFNGERTAIGLLAISILFLLTFLDFDKKIKFIALITVFIGFFIILNHLPTNNLDRKINGAINFKTSITKFLNKNEDYVIFSKKYDSMYKTGLNIYKYNLITGIGIPAGTTISGISSNTITLSNYISTDIADDAKITFHADRVFKVTGMSEDLASSGYQVDLIDKDHGSGGLDSAIVTGQITMASSKQFTVNGDITKGLFTTNPGAATLNKLSGISVLTRQKSTDTLVVLDKAMDRINLERAKLGAIMSRMEKAVDNLSNVAMNTTASKGRIVDADFALESANLTRAQILQQSATAMIAQASKSMQTVLELLR